MAAQCVPHQGKRDPPGAASFLQQQSRPPPANAFSSLLAGAQSRKEARLPALAKASGTTGRIYLGAAKWPASPRGPGLQGLPSPSVHTRRPAHPAALLSRAPALACSAQVRFVRAEGKVAPTAASTLRLCSKQFGSLSTGLVLGSLPLPCTRVSPGGQESPSHPALWRCSSLQSSPRGRWAWIYRSG